MDGEQELRVGLAYEIGRVLGPMATKVTLPLVLPLLYSIYNFFVLGLGSSHYLYTYSPFFGSVLSVVSLLLYPVAMTIGRSWRGFFFAMSGWIPYVFSLYVMAFFGGYRVYRAFSEGFAFGAAAVGTFWLIIGYWILYTFWWYTEAVAIAAKLRREALDRST